MINVGIIGATGYSGEELISILLRHPGVRIKNLSAKIDKPKKISDIFPKLKGKIDLVCKEPELEEIVNSCDLVFLALPHTVSMEIAPKLIAKGKKVIDLSADYRFKDTKTYEEFYKAKHKDSSVIKEAVYGLPELYRVKIKNAKLIANPGCYPTVSILSLAPVVSLGLIDLGSIIIDAKSGVTGAGRKVAESFLFSEINEDFKAYKVNIHQHAPEINQELSCLSDKKVKITFVPHLLPLNRGILVTVYVKKVQGFPAKLLNYGGTPHAIGKMAGKVQSLNELYKKFYKKEPFVRIREEGDFPKLKDVIGTNFCDIGIKEEKNSNSIVIIAAIDNLLKGASGQAVQNLNIMYQIPEYTALL